MNKMVAAYLRVSTDAQTEKFGLDVQKTKILEVSKKKGDKIDKWYIDGGYSGSKLDRPNIQSLIADVEKELITTVYTYKLDRMSRDTIDTLNLLYRVLPPHNVTLISVTEDIKIDTPMDKVMVTMNAAMNQYEREVIKMRMNAGMDERIKKGLWMGGGRIPTGYYYDRNDGILHVDNDKAENVKKAYAMYLDGYSCERIADILGFTSERIVSQILKHKTNIGLLEWKGKTYKGLHEPIIDDKTFYQVQELMKKRSSNSYQATTEHMLAGLCYCGRCGARMRYQKWGKYHKLVCYSQQSTKKYMIKDP